MAPRHAAIAVACALAAAAAASAAGSAPTATIPNYVVVLVDDVDIGLGSMEYMPQVKRLLAEQGATFSWGFAAVPVCCPSRSSLHTGKYQHNTHVFNNSVGGNCSSLAWQADAEKQNIAALLTSTHNSFFGGKYLNMYGYAPEGGPAHIPPGWSDWQALVGNSVFYDYTLSNNGVAEQHGNNYAKDYLTDLIHNRSVAFIQQNAGKALPLNVWISLPASHQPADPAPQYASLYPTARAPRDPAYGVHVPDSHWFESSQAVYGLNNDSIAFMDVLYRRRIQTLASVDDIVVGVVAALETAGILNNTYIYFVSDNGYHMGQYGQNIDKRSPNDYDTRIPFIVRGPGIPPNTTIDSFPVSLVDVVPTMLDLAGLPIGPGIDGLSLAPIFKAAAAAAAAASANKPTDAEQTEAVATTAIAAAAAAAGAMNRTTIFVSYYGEVGGAGPVKVCPKRDPELNCEVEVRCIALQHGGGSTLICHCVACYAHQYI